MYSLNRFQQIKENYYMGSLEETDLAEQSPPEESGQENQPTPDPPQPADPGEGQQGLPDVPEPIEGVQGEVGGEEDMMGGAMMEEPPEDPTYLGRIYELTKIYHRIHILHRWLMNSPDRQLEETRRIVSEAYDIFKLIMNNLASYKENIDDIILQYSNFIANLSILLSKHAKRKAVSDKKEDIEKKEPIEDKI